MADREHISTILNTPHSIPEAVLAEALRAGEDAFIEFVVQVVKGVSLGCLDVEERNLLARTILADIAGALRPLARMLNCTDGAAEALPVEMREVLRG